MADNFKTSDPEGAPLPPWVNTSIVDIYNDRPKGHIDVDKDPEKEADPEKETEEKPKQKAAPKDKHKAQDTKKETLHLKKQSNKEPDDDDNDEVETKEQMEINRLKKALSDSQKWGHSNAKKGKFLIKEMNSMLQNQIITEDEFKKFNDIWGSDALDDDDDNAPHEEENLVSKLIKTANKERKNLEDIYDDDTQLKVKIELFGQFLDELPAHEAEDLLEELDKISDRPLKLATKMYRLGEEYYEKYYKGVREVGGLAKYIEMRDTREQKLQKQLDKLKNKLTQYETSDASPYRLEEMHEGFSDNKVQAPGAVLDSIYADRKQAHQKRQRN